MIKLDQSFLPNIEPKIVNHFSALILRTLCICKYWVTVNIIRVKLQTRYLFHLILIVHAKQGKT